MKAFTLFLLLLPLLVQSCFANTQDVKRPKSYHERLDLSDVYGPVDLAVYVGQRVDWNIVGYVALSVTLGLIIYTLWRYSEAPPTKPESVADVGIAEPSVIEVPVADVDIAEPSIIESPVADVGIAEPSIIESPVADVGIAEPSIIESPVADVGIAEPSIIESPVATAARAINEVLPFSSIEQEATNLKIQSSNNLLPTTETMSYANCGYSAQEFLELIANSRKAIAQGLVDLSASPPQKIPLEDLNYLEVLSEEITQRLNVYYEAIQDVRNLAYEQVDICQSAKAVEECLEYVQTLKQELEYVQKVHSIAIKAPAEGMSLLSTEAPMEPALAAILEPVQGILLTVLVSLGVLRCTGSRRLSAPRVTLSLGGLGLSLATSTLLLYLGQTLLLSLVVAVLVRLVVVLVLRRRWAWFRQS